MPIRPRIAISTGCARTNERGYQAQLAYSYIHSVAAGGGAPFLLPASEDPDTVDTFLEGVDGLVLPGGPDIDPATYGELPHPMAEIVTGPRAGYDIRLCRRALDLGLPILGICQGSQVVNIALGGTLHQDILTAFPHSSVVHRRRIFPFFVPHPVNIMPGTRLHTIVGGPRIETNSAHHQSVKDLGRGLCVAARADDDIIEAVELRDGNRFVVGVQWHPEKLAEKGPGPHRELFRALVDAAADYRQRPT